MSECDLGRNQTQRGRHPVTRAGSCDLPFNYLPSWAQPAGTRGRATVLGHLRLEGQHPCPPPACTGYRPPDWAGTAHRPPPGPLPGRPLEAEHTCGPSLRQASALPWAPQTCLSRAQAPCPQPPTQLPACWRGGSSKVTQTRWQALPCPRSAPCPLESPPPRALPASTAGQAGLAAASPGRGRRKEVPAPGSWAPRKSRLRGAGGTEGTHAPAHTTRGHWNQTVYFTVWGGPTPLINHCLPGGAT